MAQSIDTAAYAHAFRPGAEVVPLGTLTLNREQLLLADPFLLPYEEALLPFLHPVPRGAFTVQMAVKTLKNGDKRCQFVRILFNKKPPTYWEVGLTADSLDDYLEGGELPGSVSETGYLALLDADGLAQLPPAHRERDCARYEEELKSALGRNFHNTFSHAKRGELCVFSAGWGAGAYPLYFGYEREPGADEALYPVCAVVDLLLD